MVSSRWDVSLSPLKSVYLLLPGILGRSADKFIRRVKYGLQDLVAGGLFLKVSTSDKDSFCHDPENADLIHWEDGYIPWSASWYIPVSITQYNLATCYTLLRNRRLSWWMSNIFSSIAQHSDDSDANSRDVNANASELSWRKNGALIYCAFCIFTSNNFGVLEGSVRVSSRVLAQNAS